MKKNSQLILFKLKSFPQVSETFVVTNILYALRKGYVVSILCDRFLGLSNSSQKMELQEVKLGDQIFPPIKQNKSRLGKLFQLFSFLIKPRNLYFTFKYKTHKSKGFFEAAFILKQYEQIGYKQVFHVHFNNAIQPLIDLCSIGYINPSVIITFHGYDAFLETKESFESKYGAFYKEYVKAVTVNSNYLKKIVLNLGVEERLIKVVPIGIDTTIFTGIPKTIKPSEQIKLLTVGRLVQLKGHLYGLQAIKILKEKGYDVHYTIVGEGAERTKLEIEAKTLEIENHVTFTGTATQAEVKDYMEQTNIFLMTSTFDDLTGRREAFGLVSVEAQAMGVPIVGFNSGGFPDTILEGETGFIVEDRNVTMLTQSILTLINNPQLYQKMSKAAIKHSGDFDNSKTTQRYLDLYKAFS